MTQTNNKVSSKKVSQYELLISFGHRKILSSEVINSCKRPPINLHISLLPYNRGADPNFWAWFNGTPHGISIHHIDEGIDTGDIVVQEQVFFKKGTTLFSSYNELSKRIEDLFERNQEKILSYSYTPQKQPSGGSVHYKKDFTQI